MFLKSMQEQSLPARASEILKDKFLEMELQRQVTCALHTGRYVWPVGLHGAPSVLRDLSSFQVHHRHLPSAPDSEEGMLVAFACIGALRMC